MFALYAILCAIIQGIVQGITEWLPISSTGHMLLLDEFLKMTVFTDIVDNTAFVNLFIVVIQLGSILAVCLLYFNRLNPFSNKKTAAQKKTTWDLWIKVLIAAIPAAIVGFLFDDFIDAQLHGPVVIALSLIIYGVIFIIIETRKHTVKFEKTEDIDYKTALFIGVFQMLALIPGTSRSGSTIIGAVLLGCSRAVSTEFSFFLAIPMMFGASLLKLIKYSGSINLLAVVVLLLGMLVAFVVSIVVIKSLMKYIRKHDFKVFGYYRIILGIIVLLYFLVLK